MEGIIVLKINKFRHRSKVASFDFDWTLVCPKSEGTFPKNADDWKWLRPSVPEVLKRYYKKGYAIYIFTNQTKAWKQEQIFKVLSSLEIPICACIAFDKTKHKPNTEMFWHVVSKMKKESSFFVGDALGRPNDWSDTDKRFADALGINVIQPEDMFPFEKEEPSNKVAPLKKQEVIVMVGYPGSGKSTIVRDIFEPAGYITLEGDLLKTSARMIRSAEPFISAGKSVVFDATNPSKKKRAEYIEYAKSKGLSVRCIWVPRSMEESLLQNNKRPADKLVPKIVYFVYRKNFEQPVGDEGFAAVIRA